jgi:hypothetical protein
MLLASEQLAEASLNYNLFGLSTRKVYHAQLVTSLAVVSYTPFSPLPRKIEAVYFLWHYL